MKVFNITFIALLTLLGGCFKLEQTGPISYAERQAIVANKEPCNHKKIRMQSMPPPGNYLNWCDECYWDIPWGAFAYHCGICNYDRCEPCNTRIFKNEIKRLDL